MAAVFPKTLPPTRITGGLQRELDVIERLAQSLPEEFEVFHHVHLLAPNVEGDRHGEVDVMVLSPRGTILLMEIKAGDLQVREGRLFKHYVGNDCDIQKQLGYQFHALLARLHDAGLNPYVTHCLVAPGWSLAGQGSVSLPAERVIDASRYERLGTVVRELLAGGRAWDDLATLRRFLRNEFEVIADLSALQDQLQRSVRTLSDGLATWVPRIKAPSGVIQVQATAGSGKTQLALRLLEQAGARKQAALYVCFNRPLADRVLAIAPDPDCVITFHELCINHYRRQHGEPDFAEEGVFADAVRAYLDAVPGMPKRYMQIVVDEAQDFEPDWVTALAAQLAEDGCLTLLGDDDQRLYEREPWEIPAAVVIESYDNFRSPRRICDVINAFKLSSRPIRSLCLWPGELPEIREYSNDASLLVQTGAAVKKLLERGFKPEDVVVVSGRGRRKARLLQVERIAGLTVRRFTGEYDKAGNALHTDGELLVESIYRYKGQSAAAVVLAEWDFSELTDMDRRKLFVGLTRAQLAVELVVSASAARTLEAMLQSP